MKIFNLFYPLCRIRVEVHYHDGFKPMFYAIDRVHGTVGIGETPLAALENARLAMAEIRREGE